MHWHQTAASQTRIILQPTSNLHASLWNVPKQEMTDYHVTLWVWAEHTRTGSLQQPRGLSLGEQSLGLLAKTFLSIPRSRPRPCHARPRPCHARPRPGPRPSWGVLEDPQGQGQASRTTRLVLIYRPRRDGRLSWPWVAGWLHTEISVRKWNCTWSPISVLTGPDVDKLCWSKPTS